MTKIPAGWKKTTLGEVCSIMSGSTPSTKEELYRDGDISWITPKDLSNHNERYIAKGERNITEEGLKNSSAQILPSNTILFSSRAPIGYVAIAKKELSTNQGFKNIVCDENTSHYLFFYYWLKYRAEYIEKISSGSTFSEASASIMRILPILLPPLPEQQAIAKVLSSFDDKIELLRAENQTLGQMGQELFKERFGKWKVGADLPEGWRVGKLGEMISLQGGFVHNINLVGGKKTQIAKMGVVDGKTFFNRTSVIGYSDIIPERHKLEEGDLIICTRDVTQDRLVIGNVALVPNDLAKFGLYAGSNTWIVKTNFHKLFLFLLFKSKNFRNHIIQSAKGSTIVMITQDTFLDTNIILPDQETLLKFDLVIKPLFNKIRANSEEIQSLLTTRDQLLPKLMSGEVRVEF